MTTAEDEFVDFFEREYARLVRSLWSADVHAADAVQEAFVKAFVRWGRVKRLDDPAGWVRRVAVNRILNERRSGVRRDAAVASLGRIVDEEVNDDPDGALDVRDAVRLLAPQQRVAVSLFYGAGLPIADVADAMRVSEGTVKSHLHAARTRLRVLLAETDHG